MTNEKCQYVESVHERCHLQIDVDFSILISINELKNRCMSAHQFFHSFLNDMKKTTTTPFQFLLFTFITHAPLELSLFLVSFIF